MTEPTRVILDTDIGDDCDDAGALAMLHAMADAGEVEILGVVISCIDEYSAPCAHAINTFFGRPDIPIGVRPEHGRTRGRFVQRVSEEYPGDLRVRWDAVELYRRLLSSQPDHSTVVIEIGHATNMSRLLVSGPDEHSELAGKDLVGRKLLRYAAGGNGVDGLPKGPSGFNYKGDLVSAMHVLEHFPDTVPLIFAGGAGTRVRTGTSLKDTTPHDHIIRRCYELFFSKWTHDDEREAWSRPSWDQLRVLAGVRDLGETFVSSGPGIVDLRLCSGDIWFQPSAEGNHYCYSLRQSPEDVAAAIEVLMAHTPQQMCLA